MHKTSGVGSCDSGSIQKCSVSICYMSIFNMSFLLSNIFWLVVSTHLKNISQDGNIPQIGLKKNETITNIFYKPFHGTWNPKSIAPTHHSSNFSPMQRMTLKPASWHFPTCSRAGQPKRGNTRVLTKPCEPLGVCPEMTRHNMNIIEHPHENPICWAMLRCFFLGVLSMGELKRMITW